MEWTNAIRSDKISEGKSKMVNIGRNVLMILKLDGEIHATEGLCKHMKWPLSWGGKLEEDRFKLLKVLGKTPQGIWRTPGGQREPDPAPREERQRRAGSWEGNWKPYT